MMRFMRYVRKEINYYINMFMGYFHKCVSAAEAWAPVADWLWKESGNDETEISKAERLVK